MASHNSSDSSSSWRQERKLLHWVNSLPPPACLLVEAPADLRFGDVLLAIVRWIETQRQRCGLAKEQALSQATGGDDDGNDREKGGGASVGRSNTTIERLRHVLRFVAREAHSEDGDAMFVVNEAQCAERIKSGGADAICAVLRILKRVSDQLSALLEVRQRQQQTDEEDTREQQLSQHAIVTNELLRLSELREATHSGSSSVTAKCKRNLRIMGLSSDRFGGGSSSSVPPTPSSSLPARKREANERQPARLSQQSAIATAATCTAPAGFRNCSAILKPKTTKSKLRDAESFQERKVPMFRDASGQLHVYSMIDPSSHSRAQSAPPVPATVSKPPVRTANKSSAVDPKTGLERNPAARRVCEWMHSLGVVLPGGKARATFESGVALSQIAAGIAKKYGDIVEKCRLATFTELSGEVVVIPEGVALYPQNVAQKRKNVAIAVEILTRYCRFGCASNREEACAKLVEFFTAKKNSNNSQSESPANDSDWELLDHIRAGVEASRAQDTLISTSDLKPEHNNDQTLEPGNSTQCGADENSKRDANADPENVSQPPYCEKRRPYITNEQMQTVNRWLKSIDKELMESTGKSLLQDPLRNGVLFCKIYARAFANQNDSPLRFAKTPKTLMEVSSPTWEAIIMGDRQITYGILWCLWQYAQELDNQNRKEEVMTSSVAEDPLQRQEAEPEEPAVKASYPSSKAEKKDNAKFIKAKKKASVKVCPLLIDIPAAALASENSYNKNVNLAFDCSSPFGSLGVHSIWDDDRPSDHDLYPQPSVAPTLAAPTEVEPELAFASQQEVVAAPIAEDTVEGDSTLSTTLDSSQEISLVMEDTASHSQATDRGSVLEGGVVPKEKILPSSPQKSSSPRAESATRKDHPHSAITPDGDDTYDAVNQTTASNKSRHPSIPKEAVDEILAWLKHLKIRVSDPAAFQTPSSRLMEFQSGVLLCCIVEKVEYMRCIQGVCRKPNLTKANALHNISKALEILQQKKTMPLHLLRCKNEIYNGDRNTVLELLRQIRKVQTLEISTAQSRRECRSYGANRSLLPSSQAYGHHHRNSVGAQQSSLKKPDVEAKAHQANKQIARRS